MNHILEMHWNAALPLSPDLAEHQWRDELPTVPAGLGPPVATSEPAHLGACQSLRLRDVKAAYARRGGLLSGDQVIAMLQRHRSAPLSVLAQWIVDRQVVAFEFEDRLHLPLFQFDRSDMTVRPEVGDILSVLIPWLDDAAVAAWFLKPNGHAAGRRPIDWIESVPMVALRAARLDRSWPYRR